MLTIGIDVGGTKVLGVAVDSAAPSTVRAERRVPTPEGGAGLVGAVGALVAALVVDAGSAAAIGVGVPGLVDRSGTLHVGPHLRHITDLPLAALLTEETGLRAVVDNDANCHAVAEQRG